MHESVVLHGRPGTLRHPLHHYAYRNISHHLATIDRYTTLAAEQWVADGRPTNVFEVAAQPAFAFLRNYLLRRGITDGGAGLVVSILNSYYVFLKFAKLGSSSRSPAAQGATDSARAPVPTGKPSA